MRLLLNSVFSCIYLVNKTVRHSERLIENREEKLEGNASHLVSFNRLACFVSLSMSDNFFRLFFSEEKTSQTER